mgnify:CR=1 FL=1
MTDDENAEQHPSRSGGQPDTSIQPANASGRVQTGAGAQEWVLADWLDAWKQYEDGRQEEKEALDDEKAELERELSRETDPLAREELQQQIREVEIERSVVDAEYDLATNPFDSGTGHFEPASYVDWAQAGGLDPYDPQTAALYNGHMPRASNRQFNNDLKAAIESEHWFYFKVIRPIDILASIPINPAALIKGGVKKAITRGARSLRKATRLAKPRRQERIRGRRNNRKRRRDCKTTRNPAFVVTGIPVHTDPTFGLAGLLPVELGAVWYGNIADVGPLGRGRMTAFDATIRRNEAGGFVFLDDDGFPITFPAPTPIPEGWVEGDTVRAAWLMQAERRQLVFREHGLFQTFAKCPDGVWRITRIADRYDNALILTRDSVGILQRIEGPEGLVLHFDHDTQGLRREVRLEGEDGRQVVVMRYDYEGEQLILADAPFGERHEFSYDDKGQMLSCRQNGEYQATYEHDEKGRRVLTRPSGGPAARLIFDDDANIVRFLPDDDLQKAITYHKTENDTIALEVDALGNETRYEEGPDGRIARIIDAEGNETSFARDADGNITAETDPEGQQTLKSWNSDGSLELEVDPEGNVWEYDYDDHGGLVLVRDPLGNETRITRNDRGQEAAVLRSDGFEETYRYDARHRLIAAVDFAGGESQLTRDEFGRISTVKATDGSVTRYTYDEEPGHDFFTPSRVLRPDGVEERVNITRHGREVTRIDGEGNATLHVFDGRLRLVSIVDPRGSRISLDYDAQDRLTTVTNQVGRRWHFERDVAGRIIRETDFDDRVLEFGYDRAGRLTETRHPDGRVTSLELDRNGQLLRRSVTLPERGEIWDESYSYDARGLLTGARNAATEVLLEYDDAGRLIAEASNGFRIESVLNCCGLRKERRIGTHDTLYSHDPLGRLTWLAVNERAVFRRELDAGGRESLRQGTAGFSLTSEYDSIGQLVRQIAHGRADPSGAAPEWSRRYQWDRAMSPREIADPFWGATRYVADPNGQVLSADHGQNIGTSPTFPLGAENERFTYTPTLDISASSPAMLGWTATDGGRVTAARGPQGERIRSTYDAAGRVTERRIERDGFRPRVWRFTWDGFDRMIGVVCPDGAAWSYIYDAFGRRTEKRLLRRGDSYPTSMMRYLWDGNLIAAEIPEGDMGRAVWWHYDPEGFTPLLREEAGSFLHVIADHLGTPRELVDESGRIVWSITHRLWGGARGIWAAEAGGNAAPDLSVDWAPPEGTDPRKLCLIRFQGQWEDPETGLHYNRFRIYDPASAQYLSPDPIGLMGGLRTAGYVDIPTDSIDPLGLRRQVPYGSTPLSMRVIAARVAAQDFTADHSNYAAATICRNGRKSTIVKRNRGMLHSEERIAEDLRPGDKVLEVYSERAPCAGCSSFLRNFMGNPTVTYSFPYTSSGRAALQRYLNGLSGR